MFRAEFDETVVLGFDFGSVHSFVLLDCLVETVIFKTFNQ